MRYRCGTFYGAVSAKATFDGVLGRPSGSRATTSKKYGVSRVRPVTVAVVTVTSEVAAGTNGPPWADDCRTQ
jgi:hypothetical protein